LGFILVCGVARDTGIGMTREELVESLGTIAQSGTAKFMKALKVSLEDTLIHKLVANSFVRFMAFM
jgi:heat shock protein beta